jgi:hypothetical protein
MSSDKLSHEFEALQRMYGEQYGGADRERRAVAAEAVFRRLVAYGFKLVLSLEISHRLRTALYRDATA